MALFGSKKNTEEKAPKMAAKKATKPAKALAPATASVSADLSIASVIVRPRITEKAGLLSQSGVYTFEVQKGANKHAVAKAVTALYKVVPVKVAVINLPSKNVVVRGRRGVASGVRKAVVTLKKGDTINFV